VVTGKKQVSREGPSCRIPPPESSGAKRTSYKNVPIDVVPQFNTSTSDAFTCLGDFESE
jgi:hypothetical protein